MPSSSNEAATSPITASEEDGEITVEEFYESTETIEYEEEIVADEEVEDIVEVTETEDAKESIYDDEVFLLPGQDKETVVIEMEEEVYNNEPTITTEEEVLNVETMLNEKSFSEDDLEDVVVDEEHTIPHDTGSDDRVEAFDTDTKTPKLTNRRKSLDGRKGLLKEGLETPLSGDIPVDQNLLLPPSPPPPPPPSSSSSSSPSPQPPQSMQWTPIIEDSSTLLVTSSKADIDKGNSTLISNLEKENSEQNPIGDVSAADGTDALDNLSQRYASFLDLPGNPPELTINTTEILPQRGDEINDGHDSSSSSYDTDSSDEDSNYETDSITLQEGTPKPPDRLKQTYSDDSDDDDNKGPPKNDNKVFTCFVVGIAFLLLLAVAFVLYWFHELSQKDVRESIHSITSQPVSAPIVLSPSSSTAPTNFDLMNDLCIDAIGPLNSGSNIRGTIKDAGVDQVDQCGNAFKGYPGVWYYVYGTGGEMMAHTCNNTDFDSRILLFAGPCSELECLHINENYCGKQSVVSWKTEFYKPYLILVQGSPALRGSNESFQLTIESRYNDECNTAIDLVITSRTNGPITKGQTLNANKNLIMCNGIISDSPSVFYRVKGTGSNIFAVLREGTDFNATLSLLTGKCSNLQCLDQSENGGRDLSWSSVESQDYYIVIHGETAKDVGNFDIQIKGSGEQERSSW